MPSEVTVMFPGDTLKVNETEITIGPNFELDSQTETEAILKATNAGLLQSKTQRKGTLYYVDSPYGEYTPQIGDMVLGTVIGQFGEYYRVSLSDHLIVLLNMYAFPNASKKNRPRLEIGDLVYARVESTHKSVDAEISCMDAMGKEGGFGILKGGYCIDISQSYARFLLYNTDAPVLGKLVQKVAFELAVAVNGKVWVKSDDDKSTMFCATAISRSINWNREQVDSEVDKLAALFKKM